MRRLLRYLLSKKASLVALATISVLLPFQLGTTGDFIKHAEASDPARIEYCKQYYKVWETTAGTRAHELSGATSRNAGLPNESWEFEFEGEHTEVGWDTDDLSYYGLLVRDEIRRIAPEKTKDWGSIVDASDVETSFNSLTQAQKNSISGRVDPKVKAYHRDVYNKNFNKLKVDCEEATEEYIPSYDEGPGSYEPIEMTAEERQRREQARADAERETTESEQQADEIYCFDTDKSPMLSWSGCGAQVAYFFLFVTSWILWVAATSFNYVINYTLNFAEFVNKTQIVEVGWVTFRDFANLFFVFIILYIAINTILGNSSYGIKSMLGKVIVAAMLINFSLFFTKMIIDTSNIFALQFYSKILTRSGGQAGEADGGISAALASSMGLHTVWGIGQGAQESDGTAILNTSTKLTSSKLGLNATNLIIVGFGGGIFIIITSIVFFAGTIMLLARTLSLIFLMILSPFAFIGSILPGTQGYAKEWWSKLFKNALFAPAYMALLYLVLSMVLNGSMIQSGDFIDMFSGKTAFVDTFATFIVLNGLMVGCIVVAQKLGAQGASFAMGMANSVKGLALGAVGGATSGAAAFAFGAAAFAGRNFIGRTANALANSDAVKQSTSSLGRFAARRLNNIANASFDTRNIGGIGKKLGIGGGDNRGIKQRIEDRDKKRDAAVEAESKLYEGKGLVAFAKRRQQGFFKATRKAGDATLDKAYTEEATKQKEIYEEITSNPDYERLKELIRRSERKEGLNDEEAQEASDLHFKLNNLYSSEKLKKVRHYDASKEERWSEANPSSLFGAIGFGVNNRIQINDNLVERMARDQNAHRRSKRLKDYTHNYSNK
ncbi:MAG: type IV secretion system protein [Candidatus Taylorbacteria bacterium]|nr:type IV secretion system protein [Candidatus Taylorbacteria bacterium]